jgi:hypothetical protein
VTISGVGRCHRHHNHGLLAFPWASVVMDGHDACCSFPSRASIDHARDTQQTRIPLSYKAIHASKAVVQHRDWAPRLHRTPPTTANTVQRKNPS